MFNSKVAFQEKLGMRTVIAASLLALSISAAPVANADGIIGGVKRPLIQLQLADGIIGGVKRPLIQLQLADGIIGGVKRPLIAVA